MNALSQRTKAIAQAGRDALDSQRTAKPVEPADAPAEPEQTPRDRWLVYLWGEEHPTLVLLSAPQTQRQMRALYPAAAGIVAE